MPSKEQMIEALRDNCGGSCLIDPENCKCFETPTQEMADDIGVDLEDMDDRYEICEKCGELKRIGRKCLSCRSDQSPIQGDKE